MCVCVREHPKVIVKDEVFVMYCSAFSETFLSASYLSCSVGPALWCSRPPHADVHVELLVTKEHMECEEANE